VGGAPNVAQDLGLQPTADVLAMRTGYHASPAGL
jgi:hypothetical protein